MTIPIKYPVLQRLINAFFYSLDGLKAAFHDEAAFRQEVAAAIALIPLAFFIAPSALAAGLMCGSIFLVMAFELINSAIEAAIDRHGPEIHPLAKKAKDTGSAAVLMAILIAVIIWISALV